MSNYSFLVFALRFLSGLMMMMMMMPVSQLLAFFFFLFHSNFFFPPSVVFFFFFCSLPLENGKTKNTTKTKQLCWRATA